MTLQLAAGLVAAQRWEEALAELLPIWRAERDPGLGAVIDAVSTLIERPPVKTLGPRVMDQHAVWLQLAKTRDLGDGTRLFSSLGEVNSTLATQRIEELRNWRPDPRLGQALMGLIELPPFQGAPSAPFWRVVWALLPQHADARTLARLRPLVGTFQTRLGAEAMIRLFERCAVEAVEAIKTELSVGALDQGLVEAMARQLKMRHARASQRSGVDEQQLVGAVAGALDDPGPRLVLADWLEERGDPRAELIRLGVARGAGEPSARERALWKRLGPAWLGPVWSVTARSGMVFDRGFLDAARIQVRSDSALLRAVGAVAWATVRSLKLGVKLGADQPKLATLLGHPVFANLRSLDEVSAGVLTGLVGTPTAERLGHLGIQITLSSASTPELAEMLGGRALFPSLQSLELHLPAHLDARAAQILLALPKLSEVKSLSLTVPVAAEEPLLKTLLPLLCHPTTLRRAEAGGPWSAWSASVAAGILRLHVDAIGPWGKILRALPHGSLLGVDLSGDAVEAVAGAAGRFGVNIV